MRYFLLILIVFSFVELKSQDIREFNQKNLELKLAKLKKKDQVKLLDSLSKKYPSTNPATVVKFFDFAIKYAITNEFDEICIGYFFMRRAQNLRKERKFSLAINDLLRAEDVFLKHNRITGLQEVCLAFANLYTQANDNVKAIKFAVRAKDYAIKLKNDETVGVALNAVANLYKQQGLYDKAFLYYKQSVTLLKKRKVRDQEALLLDNISMLWVEMEDVPGFLDSATFYSNKALAIAYELKNSFLELQLLPSASGLFEKRKEFDKQLKFSLRGKYLADSLKIEAYQLYSNLNYGAALINTGDAKKAVQIFRSCIPPLLLYQDYFALTTAYYELSRAFESLGQKDSALFYFKLNKSAEDTLSAMKSKDKVNEYLAKIEIDLKEEKIKNLKELNTALNEKEILNQEKDRLKSIIIYGAIVLLLVIIILLIITFKRFKDNKKLSKEIGLKNLALVTKNNEITDSINYAKRIQQALLPSQNELMQTFPESFILFRPKDIVSGDFYWIHKHNDIIFIAVGDCTGHGVPGGFMSMLGHSFLNQIVNEKHVHEPAQVLNQLRDKVISSLRQTGAAGENKDGMDITFLRLDLKQSKLTYAAANNSFYLIQDKVIVEYKADKQPIGYYSNVPRPFSQHEIKIGKNDSIYLFTDGFPDQFGGTKGKKLKHSTLQKTLSENEGFPMNDQREMLDEMFVTWKGSFEQTDDVCLIGIKIQ